MGLTPAHPAHDPADLLLPDAELLGQLSLEDIALRPAPEDLLDLVGVENMHAMGFATVVRLPEPALGDGISDILAAGAKPPVKVILAWAEITGVTDLMAFWDRTHPHLVSPAMGIDHSCGAAGIPGPIPEESVALQLGMARELALGPGPRPAVVRTSNIDLRPVSLLGRFTHNAMLEQYDDELRRRGLDLDDYDDDVISV